MAVLSYAETRRQAGLPHTQVGIEMWFKVGRTKLRRWDLNALTWWLERKTGKPVSEVDFVFSPRYDPGDPLSHRTYHGDGSWEWGATDGQIRVGGGVKGWI